MKIFTAVLDGTQPLLMHNEQLADPTNDYTKRIKAINQKKTLTDEDIEQRSRLEWEGGLYYAPLPIGPVIATWAIVRCFASAGTVRRLGKATEQALSATETRTPLLYDGPRDLDGMWNANMRDSRMVGVNRNRVLRIRPQFPQWRIETEFLLNTEVMDLDTFVSVASLAGKAVGLMDGRRIGMGRFVFTAKDVRELA